MSKFVKKVLVQQAELERMQQQQLREYSPELSTLARLQTQMADVIGRKGIPAEEKLSLLAGYQARFNKLQKETGVLRGTLPAAGGAPVAAAKVQPKMAATEAQTDAVNEENENDEDASQDGDDELEAPVAPAASRVEKMGLPAPYQHKARNLLLKILDSPEVLRRNRAGEIVVNGVAEPDTDFDSLFKSMVGPTPHLDQPGVDKFLDALHRIGVKPAELSGKAVKRQYTGSVLHGNPAERLATLRGRIPAAAAAAASGEDEPNAPPVDKPQRKCVGCPSPKEQSGKGLKRKKVPPPGHRPKILYVY